MLIGFSIQHHTLYINIISYPFPCFFTISWQIPKSAAYKKMEEGKEDREIVEKKQDNNGADGKVPKLEVEIKVDSKEEGEELQSHTTVTWDQPRRLVNH